MKLTKYQQNRLADIKRSRSKLVPFYQILCQHGTVSMTELVERYGVNYREVAMRVRRLNQLGGQIEVIHPEAWRNGARSSYRVTSPVDIDALFDAEVAKILATPKVEEKEIFYQPGIHETPTGRIYAYADLKPPKCDGYRFNAGFGVGSSLSPSLSFAM